MDFKNYFAELKRRNVFKAALAYVVVGWIILQVISIVFPMLNIPETISKAVLVILLICFPVWIIFAWIYEMTPEGIKKTKKVDRQQSITSETGNKFNKIIIGSLFVAIILLAVNVYGTYFESKPVISKSVIPSEELSESASVEADEKSVAVLAFADMSPEKDQEYFSDGISEEILNYLAKNPELSVISRTSSFSFKDTNIDIREIGDKLNANYILEGSVRKADSTLRITAQLIHAKDGAHIWSETYDRKMQDIFKIQDEIAQAVTRNLEASLLGEEIPKVNTKAYNQYLQAKYLWNQYTKESLENADKLVNEAIAIDGNYAPAWLLLAKIKESRGNLGFIEKTKAFKVVNEAIDKALSIDPKYAEAYAFAGRLALGNVNYEKAERNYKKALELGPRNPDVLLLVSELPTLDIKKRLEIVKKAIALDPLEYINYYRLTYLYVMNEEFEKALQTQEKYLLYYPNSLGDNATKAEILAQLGREKEALNSLEKEKDEFMKAYGLTMVSVILYSGEKADSAIESFKIRYGNKDPYMVAQMYAEQNKKDQAFLWLEKAYEAKSRNFVQLLYDPYMKNLKNDTRWSKMLERIHYSGKSDITIDF